MDTRWDATGEANAALAHVVEGFGAPVLGRPDMLEGLLKDDVPHLPREVAMLTEAARFGVADQLGDRLQQGVAPAAAIAMVANEMTSRTAVDAAGAKWAAGAFARVIGYPAADLPPTAVEQIPARPESVPTRQADDVVPATRVLDAGTGHEGETIAAQGVTIPPAGGFGPAGLPFAPVTPARQNLAVPAAIATGLALVMLAFSVLSAFSRADTVRDWTSLLPLLAGGAAIAIWTARGLPGGTSFGAVLGLTVPAVSYAVYDAAIAANLFFLPGGKRHVIEVTAIVAVLAAISAGCIAVVALRRWGELHGARSDGLSWALTFVGVSFVFMSIFGQLRAPDGQLFDNVLGPGVRGWFILWGLIFLVTFALPPVVAAAMRPGSAGQLAVWSGWLLIVLTWQISDSPIDGARAAYGLYLTWIVWLLVAIGTVVLALRGPVVPPQPRPIAGQEPQVPQG